MVITSYVYKIYYLLDKGTVVIMTTVPFLIILNLNFITNFDLMLHCFRKSQICF